ncbi:MAG TPA: DNA polymerase IV [Candidatus Binataceae bacterium]|nr:DNA polymerase IV [Candidatus Binataceae bacterium]
MKVEETSYAGSGAHWPRVIAHADMDAFYASVEVLDNPALRGLPVIVGGKSARGVVTSASYEARKFGVRSAMPSAQARKLCPSGVFLPGRMERYTELSKQIRSVFESFSPIVEPLSLDEAFIDLTGTERLLGFPVEVGGGIKRRVLDETGLVVSVGVAPTKMAAKILSDLSKPDGLLCVGPERLREFLAPLPVERIWGVGRVTLGRMNALGITTIGDLANRDPAELESKFGTAGPHLRELAMGIDSREVIADWQRKSYGEENTFARDLEIDSRELRDALIAHGDAIARRMRADGVRARTITLKVKLARPLGKGRYPVLTRSFSLDVPTDDGPEITRIATGLLARIRERERIRLAGVHAHNLERAAKGQAGLFDSPPPRDARRDRLNQALDSVAKRFGEDAVTRGLAHADRAAPTLRIK